MNDDLKKRIEQARKLGYTDEQINATITAKQAQDQTRQPQGMDINNAVQEPKDEGFIKGIVRGLVKPAVDYGNMLGGSVYESFRAPILNSKTEALDDITKKQMELTQKIKNEKDPKKKQQLVEESRKLSGQSEQSRESVTMASGENPFLTKDELKKFSTPGGAALEGAKRTAGAMSYFVPGGTGVKGAIATGAATGGLYGFSQSEGENLEDIAVDTGTGALAGAGTGALFGVGGKVLNKFRGARDAGSEAIINPQVAASPTATQQKKELVQELARLGIKEGNAQQRYQKVNEVYSKLNDEVSDILQNSNKSASEGRLFSVIRQNLSDNGEYFIPDDPRYASLLERELKLLSKKAVNGKLTAQSLYEFKNELGNKLSNAFRKESGDLNSAITDAEGVRLDLWHRIDDTITALEPKVKEKTKDMSFLWKASPGLKKQSEKVAEIRPFGVPSGVNMAGVQQGVVDKTSRAVSSVGDLAGKVPEAASSATLKGSAMLSVPSGSESGMSVDSAIQDSAQETKSDILFESPDGQWMQKSDGNYYSTDEQWVWDVSQNDWIENPNPPTGQNGAPMTLDEYNAQLSNLASQNSTAAVRQYGLLQKERDYYYPEEKLGAGGGDTGAATAVLSELKDMYSLVQQQGLTAKSGGIGRLEGAYKGNIAAFTQSSPEAANYSDQSTAFMSLLARGLGEKGVLTDEDINRVRKALPKYSDTPEKAAQGWKTIESILKEAAQKEAALEPETEGMDITSAVQY